MTKQNKQKDDDKYFLKYHYDSTLVIGDNNLKENVEVLIGNAALYCAYHNSHKSDKHCEHIKFALTLNELSKLREVGKLW